MADDPNFPDYTNTPGYSYALDSTTVPMPPNAGVVFVPNNAFQPGPFSPDFQGTQNAQQMPQEAAAELEQQIILSHNTKAVCTACGREDAPHLYLKRSHGRYDLLCRMLDGSGCWPQSSRGLCRHIGEDMVQCVQLAEWKIAFGTDQTRSSESCSDHLGRMVGGIPAGTFYVFPLED